MAIMMIIGIPFLKFLNIMCDDYKEKIVVDDFGSQIGKAYVNEKNQTADGKQYKEYKKPY